MAMKQNPGRRGGFFSNRNLDSGSMRRILILGGIFGVAAFVILFAKLWQLQVVEHEKLEGQAVTQQTREVTSSANRGTIYDTNGDVLAISADVQNVILSPRDVASSVEVAEEDEFGNPRSEAIIEAERETKLQDTYDLIADTLSDILGIDREEIMTRLQKTNSAYEVLAEKVEDDVADQVRTFMTWKAASTSPTIPSATIPTPPWPPRWWALSTGPTKGRMDWSPYTIWNCPGWMGGSSPRRTPRARNCSPRIPAMRMR